MILFQTRQSGLYYAFFLRRYPFDNFAQMTAFQIIDDKQTDQACD